MAFVFVLFFLLFIGDLNGFFKDEYAFADFLGNITVDMAKTALIAAASWGIGTFLLGTALLGGSIIAVAGIVFVVGFAVAIGLEYLDNKYQISEKVIELLKKNGREKLNLPLIYIKRFIYGLRGDYA